jgi:hypothetical protein
MSNAGAVDTEGELAGEMQSDGDVTECAHVTAEVWMKSSHRDFLACVVAADRMVSRVMDIPSQSNHVS